MPIIPVGFYAFNSDIGYLPPLLAIVMNFMQVTFSDADGLDARVISSIYSYVSRKGTILPNISSASFPATTITKLDISLTPVADGFPLNSHTISFLPATIFSDPSADPTVVQLTTSFSTVQYEPEHLYALCSRVPIFSTPFDDVSYFKVLSVNPNGIVISCYLSITDVYASVPMIFPSMAYYIPSPVQAVDTYPVAY